MKHILAIRILGFALFVIGSTSFAQETPADMQAQVRSEVQLQFNTLQNYPFDAINRLNSFQMVAKVTELRVKLERYSAKWNELDQGTQKEVYRLAKLTLAFTDTYYAIRVLERSLSGLAYRDQHMFQIRLPTAIFIDRLKQLEVDSSRYAGVNALNRDIQIIKDRQTQASTAKANTLQPQPSESNVVGQGRHAVMVQNQFLVEAFKHRYAGRMDIQNLNNDLSICCQGNACQQAQQLFHTFKSQYPNHGLLSSYGFTNKLKARVDALQDAATLVGHPRKNNSGQTPPESSRYADYLTAYNAMFDDAQLSLITTTEKFRRWIGPIKSLEELKRKPYQWMPESESWGVRQNPTNILKMVEARHASDYSAMATHVERESWKQEMRNACQETLEIDSVSDLLDWPLAVGNVLSKDIRTIKYLPDAMETYYQKIRTRERWATAVQYTTYVLGGISLIGGGTAIVSPGLFASGSLMFRVAAGALIAVSVADIVTATLVLQCTENRSDRISAAMIAQLSDATAREESLKLYREIRMLRTMRTVAAASVLFDAGALFRVLHAGGKTTVVALTQVRDFLSSVNNIPTPKFLRYLRQFSSPRQATREIADLVEEKGVQEALEEIVEQADNIPTATAATPATQTITRQTIINETEPSHVLGDLYQRPRRTPAANSEQAAELHHTTDQRLSFQGRTETRTYTKREPEQILMRLGLKDSAEYEGRILSLPYRPVNLNRSSVVLEVGPGRNPVAQRLNASNTYYVDQWPGRPTLTGDDLVQYQSNHLRGRLAYGDAADLPIKAETVDLYVSHGTFSHLTDLAGNVHNPGEVYGALSEAYRVLKATGEARIHLGFQRTATNYTSEIEKFLTNFSNAYRNGESSLPPRISYEWVGEYLRFVRLQ